MTNDNINKAEQTPQPDPEQTPGANAPQYDELVPVPETEQTGAAPEGSTDASEGFAPSDTGAQAKPSEGSTDEPLSPDQIEALKKKAAQADDYWDRLTRLQAEFENFKKRSNRQREESVRFANESLMEKIIPVLDNFDMALAAAENEKTKDTDSLKTGVGMIYNQLKSVVNEAGLEEIDATGQPFDPNWHEALSQQESSEIPEGHVYQQMRKGYKLRDRLIRPASVVVAQKPKEPQDQS